MKRGSALILALWTIAVLSVMVIAFAYEARQQKGINVYVQRRNRASHLIDAGKILAEIVLLDYKNAKEWSQDEDAAALLEDDAWYEAKRDLKTTSKCTVGPVYLDGTYPESALVMVEIESANSRSKGVININELYQGSDGTSDKNVDARWWMIFRSHNIPEELDTERDGRIKLWNILIASWKDWRDSDDTVTSIDGEECGAEGRWTLCSASAARRTSGTRRWRRSSRTSTRTLRTSSSAVPATDRFRTSTSSRTCAASATIRRC